MERTSDRLARLLGLVPYLSAHPGISVAEAAARFEISTDTLIDDLQLLFVTGRPGHMPDDLIEASWEDDRVYVGNAEEVAVPVRLSTQEAAGLLLSLEMLESASEIAPDTLNQLRTKLSRAAGLSEPGAVHVDQPRIDPVIHSHIKDAFAHGSGLEITYYVATRDELTTRIVSPRLLRVSSQWYLEAYCHLAQGERIFACAQIRSATPALAPPPPPAAATKREDTLTFSVRLAAEHAWVADELHAHSRTHDSTTGEVTATVQAFSHAWMSYALLSYGRYIIGIEPSTSTRAALEAIRNTRATYAQIEREG